MAADPAKVAATVSYLVRKKTAAQIDTISDTAFANLQNGTQVTSVSFEGGGATSQIVFDSAELLEACELAIIQLGGVGGVTPPTVTRVVFPDFAAMTTQT